MPTDTTPGVYIEEIPSGTQPIAGVDAARAVFVGATPVGPLSTPVPVASVTAYRNRFEPVGLDFSDPACAVSAAVRLFFANGGRSATIVRLPPVRGGPRTVAQAVGNAARRTGIFTRALADPDGDPFGILLTPDTAALADAPAARAAAAAIALCAARRAFALLELPRSVRAAADPVAAATAWARARPEIRHPNAALCFPWLRVAEEVRRGNGAASPNGAVAGVYARTDVAFGVWKAPAGQEADIRGAIGIDGAPPGEVTMAALQAESIDPLRVDAAGRLLVWGSRTLAPPDDAEWRYVPVRRTALYIEESLRRGLAWTVFEPNDEPLWAQVRAYGAQFLDGLFRAGAFQGASPRDAYFVRCGADTTTPADRAAGRLPLEFGFAPLKPAEFVVLRLTLQAGA